jgi:hypothetical protein
MPFRLIERICPFGRIFAVPPPLSDTCLPGAGRFTVLAIATFPPFPMFPPLTLPVAIGLPALPIGRVAFVPTVALFVPTVPLPAVPLPTVPVFPVVVTGLVVPGLVAIVDVRFPVEGLLIVECAGALT